MICEICGASAARARVRLMQESWCESPCPWVSGEFRDLEILVNAGEIERDSNGWFVPTQKWGKAQ